MESKNIMHNYYINVDPIDILHMYIYIVWIVYIGTYM